MRKVCYGTHDKCNWDGHMWGELDVHGKLGSAVFFAKKKCSK